LHLCNPVKTKEKYVMNRSRSIKKMETKWSLGSISHNEISWKLQTWFKWVCTWGILNKCDVPHVSLAPACAVLNSQHLIVLASMIPKDQKNITTLKCSMGQLFTASTWHLTPAVVKYKNRNKRNIWFG
jgi:hypothetical protein